MNRKLLSAVILSLFILSVFNIYLFTDKPIESQDDLVTLSNSNSFKSSGAIGTMSTTDSLKESNPHGGSWLDSFKDDSGINWTMSEYLNLSSGDVKIDTYHYLDPNILGWWHFDEGTGIMTEDGSLNENNGTLGGDGVGTDLPTWTLGKIGNALDYDGNDYVEVPDNDVLDPGLSDLTIESWVKFGATSATGNGDCILQKRDAGNGDTFIGYVLYRNDSNKIKFTWDDGQAGVAETISTITDLNWHHIAATLDRDNEANVSIYIDGVKQALTHKYETSFAGTQGNINTPEPFVFAYYDYDGNPPFDLWFNGSIDEVRISNIVRSALEIKDTYENGSKEYILRHANLTSEPITLPTDMNWDTLIINETQPENTFLNITILNASDNQPIPGFVILTQEGEINISSIDPLKYPSIRLNATFEGNGHSSPTLYYWGVSWKADDAWRDTFYGGQKVEKLNSLTLADGESKLSKIPFSSLFYKNGSINSTTISIPNKFYFDRLIINKTEPPNNFLNITILDANTNQPVPSYENLVGTNINISSINPHLHKSIKLQAIFESNGTNTSILHDWSVNWTQNKPPRVIDLFSTENSVYRTNTTQININVSDSEDLKKYLTLRITYKSPQDTDWQDFYLTDLQYKSNYWFINFTPPKNADLGNYSFNVSCNDSFNEFDYKVFNNVVEVLNNPPTKPDVVITPAMPKTQDDLTVIVTNVTDIEDEPIDYFYEWYKNNELQSDLTTELVPSSYVSPTEIWKCVVMPNDGNENGTPGEAVVLIRNTEPGINHSLLMVTFNEDTIDYSINLFYIFKDNDNDDLTFKYSGNGKLEVNIFDNGTVELIPEPDWFGTETLTFLANDSLAEVNDSVVIKVMPTNDDPVIIAIIGPKNRYLPSEIIKTRTKEDEWLNLTIIANDIDGDILSYKTNRTDNIGLDDLNNIFCTNNIISFLPTNYDVGIIFINISVSDNNGSKIYQDIEIEIENTNNPPSVWIIYPTEGLEFSTEAKINFSCEWYDIDLDVPEPSELLTFTWYSNLSQVSLGNGDFLENITLEAGYHNIKIEVEDREGAIANDTVNIIVIAPPPEDILGKNIKSENFWWIILIIIIVIIIALAAVFIFYKRKKQEEEAAQAAAAAEAGVLTPDIIPAGEPLPAAPAVPIALQIQPSVTPTPAVQAAVQTAVLQPRLAEVQPTVTPKLPPAVTEEKEEPSKEQELVQLDEQLLKGEISQEEYEEHKQKLEAEIPQEQAVPSVIAPEPSVETPPTPTPVPILKEPVQPAVVSPAIDTLEPIQEPQVGGIPEPPIITPTPPLTVKEPKESPTPIITGVTCPQCGSSETITFQDGSFSCSTCGNKWM